MEPRTPQIFRRVDDPDAADINDLERVCHATAPKQGILPGTVRLLDSGRRKQSCPEFRRGSLRETANWRSGALATKYRRKQSCRANPDNWEQSGRLRNWDRDLADVGNFC